MTTTNPDLQRATRWRRPAALAAALALGFLGPVRIAASADESGGTLEEIVVTAQKRQSTVLETPLSITAIGAEQLEARGIQSIEQIVQQVPGLSMRSAGPGLTELESRGLSSTSGVAPTVGFYIDDAPLNPPLTSLSGKTVVSPDLYDLSRIEVLRGPQGTLYGSGAMGGVVRLITTSPDLHNFGGSIEVGGSYTTGGNTPNEVFNAALNLPIIDDAVALRLIVGERYNSGWIDRIVVSPFPYPTNIGCTPGYYYGCARGNVFSGHAIADYKDENWEHTQSVRAELLVQPFDGLKILTTAFLQSTFQGGQNLIDVPPGPGGNEAHYQPADVREPYYDKFQLVSNTVTGDLGFAQLTAATTYWKRDQQLFADTAEAYQALFQQPFLTETDQSYWTRDPAHQFSEELRLASEGGGALQWIGGLFYSHEESAYFSYGGAVGLCGLSYGGCPANPTGLTYFADNPYTLDQYAGFGELSYTVSDFTATVGGRYFSYSSTDDYDTAGIFVVTGNATPITGGVSGSNHGFTPKFNLSYRPDKDLNLYATIAEGFRTGGINIPIPVTGAASCLPYLQAIGYNSEPLTYAPDKVWSYELGEKASLLGGRLSVNGDFYYNRWNGIQQQLPLGCAYEIEVNAGKAEAYGPELEVSVHITPEITFDLSGTYTRAVIDSPNANLAPVGITNGTRILNVPQFTENTSISYRKDIARDLVFTARLANSIVGNSRDIAFASYDLPAYDLVNARLQLSRGQLTCSLYGNNVTNTRAQLTSNNTLLSFNVPSLTRVAVNQPATFGFDLQFKF